MGRPSRREVSLRATSRSTVPYGRIPTSYHGTAGSSVRGAPGEEGNTTRRTRLDELSSTHENKFE